MGRTDGSPTARRQLRHERTHFLGRMIRAVQLRRNLQRLLGECVKRLVKFTPSGDVLRLGHRLSEFFDCHISFLKFEYFTQRRGEAEYAEVFATQILIITLRSRSLCTSA